jgi:hypothetical protein
VYLPQVRVVSQQSFVAAPQQKVDIGLRKKTSQFLNNRGSQDDIAEESSLNHQELAHVAKIQNKLRSEPEFREDRLHFRFIIGLPVVFSSLCGSQGRKFLRSL